MRLFKNEVGRPSNETLKKRKMIIIAIVIAVVLLVGGVTFTLVRTLKPIEGSGKKAEANKFAVVKNSNTCYTVYAPTNAKYWGVHVYYKQAGSSSFGNRKISSLSKYHDNDGVKSQKICFKKQKYENETFRILVKWNNGSNHKVYKTPNAWKPNGYYANNSIGWAYKDYAINWGGSSSSTGYNSNNNSSNSNTKASLTVTEPTQTKYISSSRVQLSFKHNQNKTMYYTFVNYNKGIMGYKQPCSTISANQTKYFTLDVNANSTSRYSVIKLFSDSKCSKQEDSKTTKTYYYNAPAKDYANLKISETTQKEYIASVKVAISFTADTTYNQLYYKFTTYSVSSSGIVTTSYTQPCSIIKKGDTKRFTMDVNPNAPNRYASIELYKDNKCQNRIVKKNTSNFTYRDPKEKPKITKACQKNGYVYVTASDNGKIKTINWASDYSLCSYNETKKNATKVNLKSIKDKRVDRKLNNNAIKYACVWDNDGNLAIKKVDKSC